MHPITFKRVLSTSVLAALVAGCRVPHIHDIDELNADSGVRVLAVDAQQRVVTVSKVRDSHPPTGVASKTTKKYEGINGQPIVEETINGGFLTVTCAEPSPDAMSALSTSVGGGLSDPKVAASFAYAQAQSAASIGLRTQSIQLLRDGMYRLCEGYAGGAIDGPEFNRQQRRYQNLMLSLLAIEQLTGAVVARQVGLGEGAASASTGDRADEAAANLAKANADLTAAQSALTKAQTTQSADEKACAADTTSATCGKAADDKTAVDNAQAALDKAKEVQKTNQQVLLAARSSVKAEASGAKVHFDDPPKASAPITDNTARFIAEATRTIVATTLIASNSQEDCARFFDFVSGNTPNDIKLKTLEFLSLDGGKPAAAGTDQEKAARSSFEISQSCMQNQQALIKQAGFLTPQYGSAPTGPLQVLGSSAGITLAVDAKSESFFIVGGTPSYRVNAPPSELSKEVTWSLKLDNGNYELIVSRPSGAAKESKTTIYVLDANNAHVDIPVSLSATKTAKPDTAGKISSVTFKDGNLIVAFSAPSGLQIDKATATAKDTVKGVSLTGQWDGKATITIPDCTAGQKYKVDVNIVPKAGNPINISYGKDVPCSEEKTPVEKPGSAPEPPTKVAALPGPTSGTITVSFAAADEKGGGTISSYTATATNKDKSKQAKSASTPDGKATSITITECASGDTYTVAVVSKRAGVESKAANAGGDVKCKS
jgi:hypothetical protein